MLGKYVLEKGCLFVKIGSDSNIEKYLVYVPEEHQKYKNDRDGDKFHLTVLLPDEMKSISISNYKIDYEKDINVYVFGISENIDCYYLVCGCPVADNLRKQLKLPSKQFHITLGFKGKDNHTLNKNIRSITKEDDNIIKNVISSVQHNENHKKNVEQIAELFERYPDNPDVLFTYVKCFMNVKDYTNAMTYTDILIGIAPIKGLLTECRIKKYLNMINDSYVNEVCKKLLSMKSIEESGQQSNDLNILLKIIKLFYLYFD